MAASRHGLNQAHACPMIQMYDEYISRVTIVARDLCNGVLLET